MYHGHMVKKKWVLMNVNGKVVLCATNGKG